MVFVNVMRESLPSPSQEIADVPVLRDIVEAGVNGHGDDLILDLRIVPVGVEPLFLKSEVRVVFRCQSEPPYAVQTLRLSRRRVPWVE